MLFDPIDQGALRRLLRQYVEQPDRRAELAAAVEADFQRQAAILVLDTCGFTRIVLTRGIVHFLALLYQLEHTITTTVEACGGRVLRLDGDNVFAVFDTVDDAVGAAAQIVRSVRLLNEQRPDDDPPDVSIGIGYGPVLAVAQDDVYGEQMNLACKLGEDGAGAHEVLLTAAARAQLVGDRRRLRRRTVRVSHLQITAYQLELSD
jgi:adenylate cyclase